MYLSPSGPTFNASFRPLSDDDDDDDDVFRNTLTLQAPPTRNQGNARQKSSGVFSSPSTNTIPVMRDVDSTSTATPSRPDHTPLQLLQHTPTRKKTEQRQTPSLSERHTPSRKTQQTPKGQQTTPLQRQSEQQTPSRVPATSPLNSSDPSPRVTPKSRQFDLPIVPPTSAKGSQRHGSKSQSKSRSTAPSNASMTSPPSKEPSRPSNTPSTTTIISPPSFKSSKTTSPCVLSPSLAPDFDDSDDFKPRSRRAAVHGGGVDGGGDVFCISGGVGVSPTKNDSLFKSCRVQLSRLGSNELENRDSPTAKSTSSSLTRRYRKEDEDDDDDFKPMSGSGRVGSDTKLRISPRKQIHRDKSN